MKEIRNKTAAPLRVPLPGGKTLHLGPKKVAQIADNATEHPALKKLIDKGTIELLGEGERVEGGAGTGATEEHGQSFNKPTFQRGHGER